MPKKPVAIDDPYMLAVAKRLQIRSVRGKLKYGVGMDRTDLTILDWLRHLQEELLDGAVYIERLIGSKF